MALWQTDNYGIQADRACWTLFAVTTRLSNPSLNRPSPGNHCFDTDQVLLQLLSPSELFVVRTLFVEGEGWVIWASMTILPSVASLSFYLPASL